MFSMIDVMCLTIRNYWLSGHFVTISSPFVLSGFYGKTHKFRSLPWSDTFHCYKGINVDTIHFRIIKQKVYDIYIQYFACNCFLKELLSPLLRKQTSSRKQMKQDHLFICFGIFFKLCKNAEFRNLLNRGDGMTLQNILQVRKKINSIKTLGINWTIEEKTAFLFV